MMTSLFVLGGARSGKSSYAQQRVEAMAGKLAFIATAEPGDDEMRQRIDRHRTDRGARWHTIEAPLDLPRAIGEAPAMADAILVDCLTLWLTNVILAGRSVPTAELERAITECPVPIALVANEVGFGIVPENALARQFRDEAGRLNQRVAATVDEAVLVAAGLPLVLKS